MARILRDDVDRFFDYGIDMSSNTLYIGSVTADSEGYEGGVDFLMADYAIKGLHLLDNKTRDGIKIIMNNPGGDVIHGMAIYDAIKNCNNYVTIEAHGYAMSMGSIIFQAADKRIMTVNSKFMIHYGYFGMSEHSKTVERWVEEDKKFNKWMIDLYLRKIREKHPRFKRKRVEEMCNFDTILNAQETLDLGLIDQIKGE